jgi:hypothetical protein
MSITDFQDFINYAAYFIIAETGENGEADAGFEAGQSVGKIGGPVAEAFRVIGHGVEGYEMHRGADSPLGQGGDEFIPADGQPSQAQAKAVDVPGVGICIRGTRFQGPHPRGRAYPVPVGEGLRVTAGHRTAGIHEPAGPFQLHPPHGRENVRHVVLVARTSMS